MRRSREVEVDEPLVSPAASEEVWLLHLPGWGSGDGSTLGGGGAGRQSLRRGSLTDSGWSLYLFPESDTTSFLGMRQVLISPAPPFC